MTTTHPHSSDRTGLADRLESHVETLANTSMLLPLTSWDKISNDFLTAAKALRPTPANPDMAKLARSVTVHEYLDGYEFRGDGGDYTPADNEKELIEDAIEGYLSTLRQSPSPAEQDGREAIAHRILIDAMGWHPSENGPSYTETKDDLTDRLRDLLRSPSGNGVGMRASVIEECAREAERLYEKPGWSPNYKNAALTIAGMIRALAAVEPARGVDNEAVRRVLGALYKTVDVMKSARNTPSHTMCVWPDDMKAIEDVMSFLENLRDGGAPQPRGVPVKTDATQPTGTPNIPAPVTAGVGEVTIERLPQETVEQS